MTFITCSVVMLPTNEKAKIGENHIVKHSGNLAFGVKIQEPYNIAENRQHLYILSDEEINEGDWCLYLYLKKVVKNNSLTKGDLLHCKKIIATTDKALINDGLRSDTKVLMPEIDPKFIENYVDQYNKSNIITDVLVEYVKGVTIVDELQWENNELHLKINSKDNTINIKPVKNSWNREELIELLQNCWSESAINLAQQNNKEKYITFDEWIKENL